eukprot:TRINITY_DN9503_c0_g1_i1.p1 TRINITY_DN9503_c0_g1~~TRINITY_DN9503_c0_g1_i1.p1  ORF type:complete len:277 (+),score=49.15 TRINITY_DN9503_c0_g1_i1:143-973(+)
MDLLSVRPCVHTRLFVRASAQAPDTKINEIISIIGATGFIGKRVVQRLFADGHKVQVLTRSASKAKFTFPDYEYPGLVIVEEPEWSRFIQQSRAVVNLAGAPISTRWSSEIKKEILSSRISATSKVVESINIASSHNRPSVLLNATAIGYYAKMVPLFMMFAGGPIGSGKQWFSWIHRDDLVSLIIEALYNPAYRGVLNGTAPNPVRLSEMCEELGRVTGRPSWLPVPEFAVKAVLGEGASIVLDGQKVLPKRAEELGFKFRYPHISDALKAIFSS